MIVDKETVIRSMVLREYPEYDMIFDDPMFAFIFLPRTFDSEHSVIFCTAYRSQGREVSIEKVHLDFIESIKYLSTPTQSLFDQLKTIKGFLKEETTALQFSQISRELVVARSEFMYRNVNSGSKTVSTPMKNFELIDARLFKESTFQLLVGSLTDFITSTSSAETWLKDNTTTQVLSRSQEFPLLTWLWVFDDENIIVLLMPNPEKNQIEAQYCTNGGEGHRFNERNMYTKTWNEMFASIPGVQCKNAGVIFFICGNMIRHICARNINMYNSNWTTGGNQPVIWCNPSESLHRTWREAKISHWIESLEQPYIADGHRLREVVKETALSVDHALLKTRPRLVLYLCLSILVMKSSYNSYHHMEQSFYCERTMIKRERLKFMLGKWTAYIAGQDYMSLPGSVKERYEDTEHSIIDVQMKNVGLQGSMRERYISWQFIPEKSTLSVFDTENIWPDLPEEDSPGNYIDLRAEPSQDSITKLLLRINTIFS